MIGRKCVLLGAAVGALVMGGTAGAQEVTTFSYDALGRLVRQSTSGGPQSGRATALCYDRAGNRMRYQSNATGSVAACPPPPPPPAAPGGGL
jgi:YD repeat-containing protein